MTLKDAVISTLKPKQAAPRQTGGLSGSSFSVS